MHGSDVAAGNIDDLPFFGGIGTTDPHVWTSFSNDITDVFQLFIDTGQINE